MITWLLLFPGLASANGGNIRIAEGKYLVNISSAPVTPVAGEKVAMLISFGDVATNELLHQNLRVWLEIRTKATEEIVFPKQEFTAEGGVLEFSFTYPKPSLHELFVRFEKPDEPRKIYESEDFLVDVQEPRGKSETPRTFLVGMASLIAGFLLGRYTLKVKPSELRR